MARGGVRPGPAQAGRYLEHRLAGGGDRSAVGRDALDFLSAWRIPAGEGVLRRVLHLHLDKYRAAAPGAPARAEAAEAVAALVEGVGVGVGVGGWRGWGRGRGAFGGGGGRVPEAGGPRVAAGAPRGARRPRRRLGGWGWGWGWGGGGGHPPPNPTPALPARLSRLQVGRLIGRGGHAHRALESSSGCKVSIDSRSGAVSFEGSPSAAARAERYAAAALSSLEGSLYVSLAEAPGAEEATALRLRRGALGAAIEGLRAVEEASGAMAVIGRAAEDGESYRRMLILLGTAAQRRDAALMVLSAVERAFPGSVASASDVRRRIRHPAPEAVDWAPAPEAAPPLEALRRCSGAGAEYLGGRVLLAGDAEAVAFARGALGALAGAEGAVGALGGGAEALGGALGAEGRRELERRSGCVVVEEGGRLYAVARDAGARRRARELLAGAGATDPPHPHAGGAALSGSGQGGAALSGSRQGGAALPHPHAGSTALPHPHAGSTALPHPHAEGTTALPHPHAAPPGPPPPTAEAALALLEASESPPTALQVEAAVLRGLSSAAQSPSEASAAAMAAQADRALRLLPRCRDLRGADLSRLLRRMAEAAPPQRDAAAADVRDAVGDKMDDAMRAFAAAGVAAPPDAVLAALVARRRHERLRYRPAARGERAEPLPPHLRWLNGPFKRTFRAARSSGATLRAADYNQLLHAYEDLCGQAAALGIRGGPPGGPWYRSSGGEALRVGAGGGLLDRKAAARLCVGAADAAEALLRRMEREGAANGLSYRLAMEALAASSGLRAGETAAGGLPAAAARAEALLRRMEARGVAPEGPHYTALLQALAGGAPAPAALAAAHRALDEMERAGHCAAEAAWNALVRCAARRLEAETVALRSGAEGAALRRVEGAAEELRAALRRVREARGAVGPRAYASVFACLSAARRFQSHREAADAQTHELYALLAAHAAEVVEACVQDLGDAGAGAAGGGRGLDGVCFTALLRALHYHGLHGEAFSCLRWYRNYYRGTVTLPMYRLALASQRPQNFQAGQDHALRADYCMCLLQWAEEDGVAAEAGGRAARRLQAQAFSFAIDALDAADQRERAGELRRAMAERGLRGKARAAPTGPAAPNGG